MIHDVGDLRYWIKRFQELRKKSQRESRQVGINKAFLKACDERLVLPRKEKGVSDVTRSG